MYASTNTFKIPPSALGKQYLQEKFDIALSNWLGTAPSISRAAYNIKRMKLRLVSKETVMLRPWVSETLQYGINVVSSRRKFDLYQFFGTKF